MKPCEHGNHPFSFCQKCCREMNERIIKEEETPCLKYDTSHTKTVFGADNTKTPYGSNNR